MIRQPAWIGEALAASCSIPLVLALAAAPAGAQQWFEWTLEAEGLLTPTDLAAPLGDARLFVTEAATGVRLIVGGVLRATPFLDLSAQLSDQQEGITSIAFHPDYAANGRFYVAYTDALSDSYVVEYQVSATDPELADAGSANILLGPIPQPDPIHNVDDLCFGPDGRLYIGMGDGVHVGSPLDMAHDLSQLYGKILRLDPDGPAPHVPPDNPFVGVAGVREEIWAFGLRQPWRLDFDGATGELYVADVGKAKREELSILPAGAAGAGLDLGWFCLEGSTCFRADCSCELGANFHLPVHEYAHTAGRCAIIGGMLYRGSELPDLVGRYLFSDHCTAEIWALESIGGGPAALERLDERILALPGRSLDSPTSLSRDGLGELHALDRLGGEVFRLRASGCAVNSFCSSTPNSVGPGATMGAEGIPRLSSNDFWLRATRAVPSQFGIFFYGASQAAVPFGNGTRCVGGGQLFRLTPPVPVDAFGGAERWLDFDSPPEAAAQIAPASTWHFQFWYRDPAGGGAAFNLSDGLTVAFCL